MIILALLLLFALSIAASADPEVKLGTTLVAIQYRQGVVVGADSRTSQGSYVSNRYAYKVSPLTPYCVVARSGSAAATQELAQAAREHVQAVAYRYSDGSLVATATGTAATKHPPQLLTVSQLAHWMQSKVYGGTSGTVSLLIAGFNHVTKQPELYSLAPSGALLTHHSSTTTGCSFAASGSGSGLVMGFLDHSVQDDLDEEDAIRLVQQALCQAMYRDGSSGGLCRMVVVNADGRREWTTLPDSDPR